VTKLSAEVGRGPSNTRLDFGGSSDADRNPNPGFFLQDSLPTVAIPIDSRKQSASLFGRGLNSVSE